MLFFHFSDKDNSTYLFYNITVRISNFPELVLHDWLKSRIEEEEIIIKKKEKSAFSAYLTEDHPFRGLQRSDTVIKI